MFPVENTAINDLIARVNGGARSPEPPKRGEPVDPGCPGNETAWPQPMSPQRLYELAQHQGHDHQRLVPTLQMRRRPSYLRVVIGRLVLPTAVLVSVGIMIGAYVAFASDPRRPTPEAAGSIRSAAIAPSSTAPAGHRSVAGAITEAAANLASPASAAREAVPPAPLAPAPAVEAEAAAPPPVVVALVDVRVESTPSGATVMLVDRGRTQFVGTTPIDVSVDPSREYDLALGFDGEQPHVEHLDPRTMRRIAVVLGH